MNNKGFVLPAILLTVTIIIGSVFAYGIIKTQPDEALGDVRVLTVPQGGTGASSFTVGECLVGAGTGAITTQSCSTGSGGGSNWQAPWTNTLTPTSTSAGIFVNASSTFNSTLRVNGNSTTTLTGDFGTICFAGANCKSAWPELSAGSWDDLTNKPATSTILNLLDTQNRVAMFNSTTTNIGTLRVYTGSTLSGLTTISDGRIATLNATTTNVGTLRAFSNAQIDGSLTVTGTFDPNGAVTLPTTGITGAGTGSGLDADKLDGVQGSVYFKDSDVVMNTNPFGGRELYINSINNAAFRAESRWVVTGNYYNISDDSLAGTYTQVQLAALFDGNYETTLSIPAGTYAIVNVNFSTEPGGQYRGYPYGNFYLSHYHTSYTSTTTASTLSIYSNYEPHGIGWHTYDFSTFYDNGSSSLITKAYNGVYAISQAELKMYAPIFAAARVSEVDWQLDRPGVNEMPLVDKYRVNNLYSTLNIKNSSAVTNVSLNPSGYTYFNGGNVGIGTASPAALLHASSTTEQLRLSNGSVDNRYASLTVANTGSMTIDLNVANATTTFSDNLVVSKNLTVTEGFKLGSDTVYDLTGTGLAVSNGALSVTGMALQGTSGAWENIWTNTLTPTSTTAGIFVNASSTFNSTLGVNGNFTVASGATTTIGNNAFVVRGGDGRVGIGTASPERTLHIGGPSGNILLDNGGSLQGKTISGAIYSLLSAWTDDSIYLGGDAGFVDFIMRTGSGAIRFRTAGSTTDKMTILNGGNVGIATTTPGGYYGEKLTVVGGGYITGGVTTTALRVASLNVAGDDISDITGSGLAVVNGALTVTAAGGSGTSGAWETAWANALTPTSTTAGIFVNASSTFNSTLRVNSSFYLAGSLASGLDGSGACSANYLCTGGHTHVGVNETYGTGWNGDTDTPEKDDIYDYLHLIDTDDDGDVDTLNSSILNLLNSDSRIAVINATTSNVDTLCIQGDCKTSWPAGGSVAWDDITDKPATSTILNLLDTQNRIAILNATTTNVGTLAVYSNATVGGNATTTGNQYVSGETSLMSRVGVGADAPPDTSSDMLRVTRNWAGTTSLGINNSNGSGREYLLLAEDITNNKSAYFGYLNTDISFGAGYELFIGNTAVIDVGSAATAFNTIVESPTGQINFAIGGYATANKLLGITAADSVFYNPTRIPTLNATTSNIGTLTVITGSTFPANDITDAEVSDTLTASNLVASGSVVADAEVDDSITINTALQGIFSGDLRVATLNATTTKTDNLTVNTTLSLPANAVTDAMVSNTLTCSDLQAASAVVADSEVVDALTISTSIEGIFTGNIRTNALNATTTKTDTLTVYGNSTMAAVTTTNLAVSGLLNCDTIDTDASGSFKCGTDASTAGSAGSNWDYFDASTIKPTTTVGYFISASSTVNSTLRVTGALTAPGGITGALTGNASTASALSADPSDCAAGTVATAIAANGNLTCSITPLISGGTLTSANVCQYDGTGIDCNLTKDGSGDCASGAVCLGDHTHSTYATLANPTFTGLQVLPDARAAMLNSTTTNIGTLTVFTGSTLNGLSVIADGRLAVINSTTTKSDNLTVNTSLTSAASTLNGLTVIADGRIAMLNSTTTKVDNLWGRSATTTESQYVGSGRIWDTQEKCFTLASTTWASVKTDIPLWHPYRAITVVEERGIVIGGTSAVLTLSDGTNNMDALTAGTTLTKDSSLSNNSWVADELMQVDVGTITGAVDYANVCIIYRYD